MAPNLWDIAKEHRLLLHIIEVSNPKPPSWAAVADRMGDGISAEACRQHFAKIKREALGATSPAQPKTPKKAVADPTTKSPTKSPGRKRKAPSSADDDAGPGADDADVDNTITTPSKTRPIKKPRTRKTEVEPNPPTFSSKREGADPEAEEAANAELYDY